MTFFKKSVALRVIHRRVGAAKLFAPSCAIFLAFSGAADAFDLPSGVAAELQEVLIDKVEGEDWVRFRFIAPAIDRRADTPLDFADLEPDFPHLCTTLAVPYLAKYELQPTKVVISLSDRAVKFGTADPEATQYFEQFRIEGGDCIWEGF